MMVNKIILLPLHGIGDVLLTTPALRNLKEKFRAQITYLHMFTATKEILDNNPYIDQNIYFPFLSKNRIDSLKFLWRLRNKFDCSINFYPSNRKDYNLAAFVINAPLRIGHRYMLDDIKELNFLKTRTICEDAALHCVEENLKLLGFLGISQPMPYNLEIYLTENEKTSVYAWLEKKGINKKFIIGLHMGCGVFKNHIKRRWPLALFAKLIDKLAFELPESVFLLFGGEQEKELKDSVILEAKTKERIFAVDLSSIRQSAAVMEHCRIFISNDSGLMHLAAALGVKTAAIFGPTNPVWVKPWKVQYRIVRLGLPCSPCFKYSPRPLSCPAGIDYACIKDISVEKVFTAAMELLEGN